MRVLESEEKVNGLQLVEGKNVRGSLRKKRGAKGVRSHTSLKLTSLPVEGLERVEERQTGWRKRGL